MRVYQVRSQEELVRLAGERGWIETAGKVEPLRETVPAVEVFSIGTHAHLSAEIVETRASEVIRIPEATIHGRNFSLLIEDGVYPGGFAHSFRLSAAWSVSGPAEVRYEPKELLSIDATGPQLLGILSHWGHFFVDALDRLLRLEELGRLRGPMLVSDPDFFSLEPMLDECGTVPQTAELLSRLGIHLARKQLIAIYKYADYRVRDLTVCTLRSKKPAISSPTFLTLRERLFGDRDGQHASSRPVVFVGRADVKKRFILDQAALVECLEKSHAVTTVYPEHLSTAAAIHAFRSASAVILPIGSAKFNLAYCKAGTRVVCIVPSGYSKVGGGVVMMVRHLCSALDLRLAIYEVDTERHEVLLNSNLIIGEGDVRKIMLILRDMS